MPVALFGGAGVPVRLPLLELPLATDLGGRQTAGQLGHRAAEVRIDVQQRRGLGDRRRTGPG